MKRINLFLIINILALNLVYSQNLSVSNFQNDHFKENEIKVIGLGEATHADGATFAKKVELIKYLHENCNYNVLLFESPIIDLEIANNEIETDSLALLKGIYGVWGCNELKELSVYIYQTRKTNKPLKVAGFDCQSGCGYTRKNGLSIIIKKLIDTINIQPYKGVYFEDTLKPILGKYLKFSGMYTGHLKVEDTVILNNFTFNTINEIYRLRLDTSMFFKKWIQILKSFNVDSKIGFQRQLHERDSMMADNIFWHINNEYNTEKIILWGATSHIGYEYGAYNRDTSIRTMGFFLRRELKDSYSAVGFTSYSGTFGMSKLLRGKVRKPKEDCLEFILHSKAPNSKGDIICNLKHNSNIDYFIYNKITKSSIGGHYYDIFSPLTPDVDIVIMINRMKAPNHIRGRYQYKY